MVDYIVVLGGEGNFFVDNSEMVVYYVGGIDGMVLSVLI